MFEILCEGKGERILDLLSDAAELVLQQSATIKGLKEVSIPKDGVFEWHIPVDMHCVDMNSFCSSMQ
jgi:hypothetical protein